MVAFPYYGAADIAALNAQAAAILALFEARGYTREEPAILQPAELFLDRSGEEIRRRTFTLTDQLGRELCLRPDLTIPICKHAVDAGLNFPARICYNGLAFRHQPHRPQRPTQFFQAGVELLGVGDAAAGEREILALTFEALRAAGLKRFELLFGDLALYYTLVDALDVPPHWGARLKRHFWRAGSVEDLLQRLGRGAKPAPSRAELEAQLDALAAAPAAGRARAEIVDRAMAQAAEEAALKLDPAIAGAITRLFQISGPAREAVAKLGALLRAAGIKLDGPMAAMHARLETIAALGLDLNTVRFTAHFGRNMEYYTGFVFEVWGEAPDGPMQIAGGGRYDTLMQMLGAPRPVSAIGCAIRTERLLAAKTFAGAKS